MAQGKKKAAREYTDLCREFDHARRSMLHYYNHVMSNGKWNGILTPEDFPPPRTAMHPACMPPAGDLLSDGKRPLVGELHSDGKRHSDGKLPPYEGFVPDPAKDNIIMTVWNDGQEIVFTQPAVKWIEIGNEGDGPIKCRLTGPDWIRFAKTGTSEAECLVDTEVRILFAPDREKVLAWLETSGELSGQASGGQVVRSRDFRLSGFIKVRNSEGKNVRSVSVSVRFGQRGETAAVWGAAFPCSESIEDDGRICVEAVQGSFGKDKAGWKLIPNLGRDSGSLVEARESGAQVSWQVTVLTPGSHLLELHRFPTLNSVGTIQVGVSVDQGPMQTLETESNDEYRGTWKENIRNNVDKICLRLPYMEAGTHRITFYALSRYFAFTRFVIYTGDRKENSLGRGGGDQRLPQVFGVREFVEKYYGKEAAVLLPRPVLYLPKNPLGGALDAEDIVIQPSVWGKPVRAEELVESGRYLFEERAGKLLIECGTALADTPFAGMENYRWQWCVSPSHGETGLAMYIRHPGKRWSDAADAPALRYRFRVQGGNYDIWIRAMMLGDDTSHFTIGLDEALVPESALYGGRGIWRYSNEQVWKWIPLWKAELAEGEHDLRIVTFSSRLRFEQIYITSGSELPPASG